MNIPLPSVVAGQLFSSKSKRPNAKMSNPDFVDCVNPQVLGDTQVLV
jgi:hypothetical protein